jgi:myo-inositol-1(or 4)-monophosphatase
MISPELARRTEAACAAVRAQIDFFHAGFGQVSSQWKSDGTRVTPADLAISENIFRELGTQFPEDQYLSEELGDATAPIDVTARFSWILDPIDGTNNYALGIPHCAISLALLEDGQPVYGVVYDLGRKSLMRGGPGFGVWDGAKPCRVSTEPLTKESLIGFHSPFDKTLVERAQRVLTDFKIRGLGSATLHLAYVAAGLLDGSVDFNVKIWDLAAAIPLCRAAGGEVKFLNGEQLPVRRFDLKMDRIIYAAGSPAMCARLADLIG